MSSSKLGFGMMRLPQRSPEATDIDFDQVSQMVDRFLAAGFTYFDTSWTYHNGASETAVKRCLVSRHPRDSFVLASKLPTFAITKEEEAEEIFNQQLERCGVDYFDYYLLHNVNWMRCARSSGTHTCLSTCSSGRSRARSGTSPSPSMTPPMC